MLISILEIIAVIAVIVGFIHEDKLIAFEDRVRTKIRAKRSGRDAGTRKDS